VPTMLSSAGRVASRRLASPLLRPLGARALAYPAKGTPVPSVEVDYASWPPTPFNFAERLKGKKTIVVGLPGAFTPT